jgi:AraC family transcriptional regulator
MPASADHVPVTFGTSRSRSIDTDGLIVTSARFPANTNLTMHMHGRPTVAVVLRGSFDESTRGRSHPCPASTVLMEPAGELHGNRFDAAGADVLIVQPGPEIGDLLRPLLRVIERGGQLLDPTVAAVASLAAFELRAIDDLTPLAVTGLAFEVLARTARLTELSRAGRRPPRWLTQAYDLLHDRFAEPLRVTDIAAAVGVHPVHLSRTFRANYGVSVSTYVRDLRIDWAASRLATSDDPIADIAARAGFVDQSHLGRAFRARRGVTPREWRRLSQKDG